MILGKIKKLFKRQNKENTFKGMSDDIPNVKDEAFEEYTKHPFTCIRLFKLKYGYDGLLAILQYNALNNIVTPFYVIKEYEEPCFMIFIPNKINGDD